MGRVEEERGGVQVRWRRGRANDPYNSVLTYAVPPVRIPDGNDTSFVVALAEKTITPFLQTRSSEPDVCLLVIRLSDEFHVKACVRVHRNRTQGHGAFSLTSLAGFVAADLRCRPDRTRQIN